MSGLLVFLIVSISLWTFLWRFLPWVSKLACLYKLHSLREQVYAAGDGFPESRATIFYRDAEFLVTFAIHTVRDGSYEEATAYTAALLEPEHPVIDKASLRWQTYIAQRKIYSGPAGKAAREQIVHAVRKLGPTMVTRTLFGNPVALFAMVGFGLVAALSEAIRNLVGRDSLGGDPEEQCKVAPPERPEASISSAVAVTTHVSPITPSLFPSITAMVKNLETRRHKSLIA